MEKFSLDTFLKKELNEMKEKYKWWDCNLVVQNGKLYKKGSKSLIQITKDSDIVFAELEKSLEKEDEARKKRRIAFVMSHVGPIVLTTGLLLTAIGGLVALKREGEYDNWKVEQMQIDGVVDYFRKGPDGPEVVPKKGTDMSKYSKEEYKKAKAEEKGHGR